MLAGMAALVLFIRFPLTEGRAANLDLFSIYTDPFILFGYAAAAPFFIALYKAFRLLVYIGKNQAFSVNAVKAAKHIKYCAISLCGFIVMAAAYVKIFHDKNDDPAGFLAICILAIFAVLTVAAGITVFEKILQNGIDIRSANEQQHAC